MSGDWEGYEPPLMQEFQTPPCWVCKEPSVMVVVTEMLRRYHAGALIQDAFPNMSAEDRERIKTGIHEACWKTIFPPEEE